MGTHTIGQDLKERGQAASLRSVKDSQWDAFVAILAEIPDGQEVTVNDVRDPMDAAGIPFTARGGMFNRAVKAGMLTPLEFERNGRVWRAFTTSTGDSAHNAQVRVYVRGYALVGAL